MLYTHLIYFCLPVMIHVYYAILNLRLLNLKVKLIRYNNYPELQDGI